jgi:hypothetical protein
MQHYRDELKQKDYKNFIASLFAPLEIRNIIHTIILFDNEISEIALKTSEPIAKAVRYQWWRDALIQVKKDAIAQSPLLYNIMEYEIDICALDKILSLHQAIGESGFLEDNNAIDNLFLFHTNALELIGQLTDQYTTPIDFKSLYKIAFMTKALLNYFKLLDHNLLKPFTQSQINQYQYNPDIIHNPANNHKLSLIAHSTHQRLTDELEKIIRNIDKPSRFLKAYIYNIKYQLSLLKKHDCDLQKQYEFSKLRYLLCMFFAQR